MLTLNTLQEIPRGELSGAVALVIGGGSGIGASTALQLGALGATVVVAGRRTAPLENVVNSIEASGGIALAHSVDVTEEAAVEDLVGSITDRFGGLHYAVNSAGDGHMAQLVDTDTADFEHVMRVNVHGTFFAMRAELRAMKTGGAIVNVSSVAGIRGWPNISAYCAAKHAVVGLTRSAALEAAAHGIRVNAVAPGTTETELLARLPEDAREAMANACTLRRIADPDEIASSIVYLLTHATYSTGLVLPVDGGSPSN